MDEMALVKRLRRERDEAREEVRQLRDILLGDPGRYERMFGLTNAQATIFALLVSRKTASRDVIHATLEHRSGKQLEANPACVQISRMRAILKPYGIQIHTVRGVGYFLDDDVRQRLRNQSEAAA